MSGPCVDDPVAVVAVTQRLLQQAGSVARMTTDNADACMWAAATLIAALTGDIAIDHSTCRYCGLMIKRDVNAAGEATLWYHLAGDERACEIGTTVAAPTRGRT